MTDGGTLVRSGVWSVHQRPRALRQDGTTYFGWINHNADVGISAFDTASNRITHTTLASLSLADDHSSPAIYVRDDDRFVVFWADRQENNDRMRWKISDDPLDISSWSAEDYFTTSTGGPANYPQPVGWNGNLRIYYRNNNTSGNWAYRESTDDGQSFGSEQLLTDLESGHTYTHPRVDGGRLHFTMGDHRMDEPSIFHWYLEDGDYYESDGTLIQSEDSPISSLGDLTTVYDSSASGNNPAKLYDLEVDSNGNPVVAFTEHVETGAGGGDGDYRARWAKWGGSQWIVGSEITPMGGAIPEEHYYEAGLSLDSEDPTTVYVAVETSNRNYQIQEWTTNDGGSSWTKVDNLSPDGATLTEPTKRARPISPRGHDGDLPVMWWAGRYDDFVDYRTQVRRE